MSTQDDEHGLQAAIESFRARASGINGNTVDERALVEFEQKTGRPIPPPARAVLKFIAAEEWQAAAPGLRLVDPEEMQWYDDSALSELGAWEDEPQASPDSSYFFFAAGDYGDAILYVECSSRFPPRSIILADHEGGDFVVLESSMAQWLGRLVAYNGVEYAYMMGEIARADEKTARRFLTRHRALNPGSEWAARQLMRLDYPQGHPLGYHHWDESRQSLVPIGQAGDVPNITLDHPTQIDLQSVAAAGKCSHLMMVGRSVADLSPLASLSQLEELYIYDFGKVDAKDLARSQSLRDICFLRCHVLNLQRLASIKSLVRLRLNECNFNEEELKLLRAQLRKLKVEL